MWHFALYFLFILLNRTKLGVAIGAPIKNWLISIETDDAITSFAVPKLRYVLFDCPVCFIWWLGLASIVIFEALATFPWLILVMVVAYFCETVIKLLQK